MAIDKELEGLLDPNLTNEQLLDNIEKALAIRDEIIVSETSSEDEKSKAKEEKARIEKILVNAVNFKNQEKLKLAKVKIDKLRKKKLDKAKKAKRKASKLARKRNR